ncbi:asparagine synthase (glutamine-hydrolyzing) [Hahella ganghwensis]|uniref:asparagine synthase (glutamine-hydrolyzing) n=1 Tax=Hahella ganghwensis TaxID=286420 RepID=UPI00037B6FE8|nr:asparagine synthase (glutamine-hydrolyzing) [Hahella ganghwensis]
MCGIAGYFGQRPLNAQQIDQAQQFLARRGPDAVGQQRWNDQWQITAQESGICNTLIHTRLAIMDTRSEANQPMCSDDRQVWLCYNGEVYDWQRYRDKLIADGANFKTHSDTEFLLQAYLKWGIEGLLQHLRGMFAFTIVDLRHGKIYSARDRFGLKPLVYYYNGKDFAFSSLVRAITPLLPTQDLQFSPAAIDAYLAHRYIPAPMTIYSKVNRLESGHLLTFDIHTRQLDKRPYWTPAKSDRPLMEVLDEAIRIRTVADRPVGVFLSGGIDSTVVSTRLAAQGYHNIHAFTAAFPGSDMDESIQAEKIARQIGLPHTAVNIPTTIAEDFDQIVQDFDEPFADPSGFPLWYLSREASHSVKVVLNGDGGDELFGGYKRYPKHVRSAFRRHIHLPFLPIKPSLDGKGSAKILAECAMSWQQAYGLRFSGLSINQRLAVQSQSTKVQPVYWRNFPSKDPDPLKALLEIDRDNYLAEYILRKADLMTMAHGLEGRSPLIDHAFYESVLSLKDVERFTDPAKNIFAPVCAELGENNPLKQKKKGFNPPLNHWLRVDLKERFDGLGSRLTELTQGQVLAQPIDEMCSRYQAGENRFAEQALQLLILDTSLSQLQKATQTRQ